MNLNNIFYNIFFFCNNIIMDSFISRQEAEKAMANAMMSSTTEYPPLDVETRVREQPTEEPRRYNQARQRKGTKPVERTTVEQVERPTLEPIERPTLEPVKRQVVHLNDSKKVFNKETKKLNVQIVGLYKNLKILKENRTYNNRTIIYQFKRAVDNMINLDKSNQVFEMIRSGSENIYFSDSFFNLYQSFNEVKNRSFVGLVQLNDERKIYDRLITNQMLNNDFDNLEKIMKFDLITLIIMLYQKYRNFYNEDSVEGLILRMQQSINVILSKNDLQDDKDMIYFFINQILIGHNSNELKVNLIRSDQQKQNIERVIAASEQQRAERIRDDTRYQQIRQRQERNRKQSTERQINSIYKGIMEDLETNIRTQIREGRDGQRGSLTRQLRNMVEQRFETVNGEVTIKVPEEFIDPFTYQIMRNPVIVSDGRTYDITSILNLRYPYNGFDGKTLQISSNRQTYLDMTTTPPTRIEIGYDRPKFIKNEGLRQRINNYLEQVYPGLTEAQISETEFNF